MEKALLNKIIPFSNVDGPGNRMAIFFQGCSFSCLYCHNPETISLCNNCGDCIKACPVKALNLINNKVVWDEDKCINCDTCLKTCKNLSSPKVKEVDVDYLFNRIKEVKPYIRGITVSGGECTLYSKFLEELFIKVKNELNLTCLIDSNGSIDFEKNLKSLIDISDGVMLDVKAINNDFHKEITSKSNEIVVKNLKYLLKINKLEEVRTVCLPNFTKNNEETVKEVSKIIKNNTRYKLIKYRYFGVRKEGLNKFNKVITLDEEINRLEKIANENGCFNIIKI